MRFIILTMFLCAAMSFIAGFALVAEGELIWSIPAGVFGVLFLRMGGWLDHRYKN